MSQAGLRVLDAWSSREWREKERRWRAEKVQWRQEEMAFRAEERASRQQQRDFLRWQIRCREEDLRQRKVENSRYLWQRFVDLNRLEVGEKAEQLRSLSWLTGLIASFTFTSPVEFSYGSNFISTARLTAYAICAALVPSLMTIASILCINLIVCILKTGKWLVAEVAEEEFMTECRNYAEMNGRKGPPPVPCRTFAQFWDLRCEDDWKTCFRLFACGIAMFQALLCTMAFIKFNFTNLIAVLFSVVILIFFMLWLKAQITWGSYLQNAHAADGLSLMPANNLLCMRVGDPFKWHACPVPGCRSGMPALEEIVEHSEGQLLVELNAEALSV